MILRLLRRPSERPARRLLARIHPADLAQYMPLLTPAELSSLWETMIGLRRGARTLRELDDETARACSPSSPTSRSRRWSRASPCPMPPTSSNRSTRRGASGCSACSTRRPAAQIRNLMRYGSGTAGALMDPNVPRFFADETVERTLVRVREIAEGRRLFYLYVVDERDHLLGIVSLWQLVSSNAERRLRELISAEVVTVRADTPEEEVARVFRRYDLLVVPVVDDDGRLAGAIAVDDVLDVVEESATEDLYRLANLDVQEGIATPGAPLGPPALSLAPDQPLHRRPRGERRLPVPGDDREVRDPRRLHADRGRHGRQRRHTDPDRAGGGVSLWARWSSGAPCRCSDARRSSA